MNVQQNAKTGALYLYIGRADAIELGWKKGDSLKTCVDNGVIRIQKRGVPNGNRT